MDRTIFVDDPDPFVTATVAARDGLVFDWTSPTIAIGPGPYTVVGSWDSPPAAKRTLRIPLTGLTVGRKSLYLRVPGGTDIPIGHIVVKKR